MRNLLLSLTLTSFVLYETGSQRRVATKMSIISLPSRATSTQILLPSWSKTGDNVVSKYIIIAPQRDRVLLRCQNKAKVVECEEGVLTVANGEPSGSACLRRAKSNYNYIMLVVANTREFSNTASCTAFTVTNYIRSPFIELTNDDSSDTGATNSSAEAPGTTCPCGWTNKKRIVGGTTTGVNEYPYMAALVNKKSEGRFCGASIIGEDLVMTAAHCVETYPMEQTEVVVGDFDMMQILKTGYEQTFGISQVAQHEGWSTKTLQNDIAILKLDGKIKISQKVGPVCLPSAAEDLVGKTVTATGWGLTKTLNEIKRRYLMKVNLKVLNFRKCMNTYPFLRSVMSPTQLCTYEANKDTCQGDSGGPVVYMDPDTNRLTQVGIVSFGQECGSPNPSVNTEVAAFMPWIRKAVAELSPGKALCTKK